MNTVNNVACRLLEGPQLACWDVSEAELGWFLGICGLGMLYRFLEGEYLHPILMNSPCKQKYTAEGSMQCYKRVCICLGVCIKQHNLIYSV